MADVKQCDRCGSYYEPYNEGNNKANSIMTVSDDRHGVRNFALQRKDLCPNCMTAFGKWLEEGKTV